MDELLVAQDLLEALNRAEWKLRSMKHVRPLEIAMRKAFRDQGRLMSKKMPRLRNKFEEGKPLASESAFVAYARFLDAPVRESALPSDWLKMWIEVVGETADAMIVAIEKAAGMALMDGARAMISDVEMSIKFDLKNPRAVKFLQDYGAKQVAGINKTTWETLNNLVTTAADEGWSYKRTAETIVEQFEDFAVGRPQEHIVSRAHMVAVAEVGNAYEVGNYQMAMELKNAGLSVEKHWDTVGDAKVSAGCLKNEEAGWIELEEPYPSGHQHPLRHPACRCEGRYRVKE